MTDWIDSLERLSALRAAGHVSEAEFDAAKARILAQQASSSPPDQLVQPASARRRVPTAGPLHGPAPVADGVPMSAPARPGLLAAGAIAAVLVLALLVWLLVPSTTSNQPLAAVVEPAARTVAAEPAPTPRLPVLALGETIAWNSDTAPDLTERQIGPLVVRIRKQAGADTVAPMVEVAYGEHSVRMAGEDVGPTYTHRVTAFANRRGAAPVVMLQSYTGGAHCCVHVQLAGLSAGVLRVIDLGNWDGDEVATPTDLSKDGRADFVFSDQSFLYAFAAYAMSHTVPKVLNVVNGRVVDVSARPAFRSLFVKAMGESGATCRTDADGMTRNGACAAYVAAAARVGRLQPAWDEMLAAYDASTDWIMPTGCAVRAAAGGCPEAQQITYKSYPEALLAFLKREGYVASGWLPAEAYRALEPPDEPQQEADETPTI